MQTIRKDFVLAAVVRTFFKYFTTGVIEQTSAGQAEAYEPKNIKMQIVSRFEHISRVFNSEAFYAIARMNYEADTIEQRLREFIKPDTTDMDLVKMACKTETLYNIMVNEYKRNLEQLLTGNFVSDPMDMEYEGCEDAEEMDIDLAEDIINRMAANAYKKGQEIVKGK